MANYWLLGVLDTSADGHTSKRGLNLPRPFHVEICFGVHDVPRTTAVFHARESYFHDSQRQLPLYTHSTSSSRNAHARLQLLILRVPCARVPAS